MGSLMIGFLSACLRLPGLLPLHTCIHVYKGPILGSVLSVSKLSCLPGDTLGGIELLPSLTYRCFYRSLSITLDYLSILSVCPKSLMPNVSSRVYYSIA